MMTNIDIKVTGAHASVVRRTGILTTGMVGATATFAFDALWDGLTKAAVFRCRGVTWDQAQWEGSTVRIPPEVLVEGDLYAGVEGWTSDGKLVVPTVWTRAGYVNPGANASGDPSTDPSLPVWAQHQAMIGDLDRLGTTDKASLVAAINEVLSKSGGAVDEAEVQRMVEEYLVEHPPKVTETDPTVPDWAKQSTKPSYTAEEVGALPDTTKIPSTADDVGALPATTFIPETAADVGAITAPATATVGQTIVVKEVDENGKPISWECADVGNDEETPFASVTMTGVIYPVLAYADNVITLDATDLDGRTVTLRKADYSDGVCTKLAATETAGQYTVYNMDGTVGLGSYINLTNFAASFSEWVVDAADADAMSISGLSVFEYLKIRVAAPRFVTHGSRDGFMIWYQSTRHPNIVFTTPYQFAGQAFKGVYEMKPYDLVEGKMVLDQNYVSSAVKNGINHVNKLIDYATPSDTLKFGHYAIPVGTRLEVWGR
ncbi:MAG: hypothetical protein IJW45_04240 [Oscillospiraceae bacterium]|nr:hypothetical protein [Oscillospiraceae bacterium]